MIEAWEARLAGDSQDAETRFEAAKELAAMRGFRYLPAARVAKLPREELLQRIEAVQTSGDAPVKTEAAAILGIVAEPPITVSRALELFWTLAKAKTLGKSEAQVKKWKSPIKQAVRDFIAVVGDKAIHEIIHKAASTTCCRGTSRRQDKLPVVHSDRLQLAFATGDTSACICVVAPVIRSTLTAREVESLVQDRGFCALQ